MSVEQMPQGGAPGAGHHRPVPDTCGRQAPGGGASHQLEYGELSATACAGMESPLSQAFGADPYYFITYDYY